MSKFILPNIGEGIDTVSISELLIESDQTINENDTLMVVESDKASMEIPANFTGTIKKVYVKSGDLISPGKRILDYETENKETLDSKDEKIEEESEVKETSDNEPQTNTEIQTDISESPNITSHATPSIKKLARKMGCDISKIIGTGENNRITTDDIYNYINSNLTSSSTSDKAEQDNTEFINQFSKWGKIELIDMSKIQQTTAKRLTSSWQSIPHVTQFEEVDITVLDKIVKVLKKVNKNKKAKVSYLPFFIKIVSQILKNLPIFNSSLNHDNKTIIRKNYINIGIAVDTEEGLVVPVIKNVDQKSLKSIAIELHELINKARIGKLSIKDMSGGCFTISSLGNIGGHFFTPIINPPEVAILGISRISIKPILINNKFSPRKMLPISLSYDHRIINGSDAATFTNLFSTIISNPSKIK